MYVPVHCYVTGSNVQFGQPTNKYVLSLCILLGNTSQSVHELLICGSRLDVHVTYAGCTESLFHPLPVLVASS